MKTKIPEPKRLPSGSWHVRLYIDGTPICITRPTRSEVVSEAMALRSGAKAARQAPGRELTLSQAIDRYIQDRQNILSPATIRGYRIIQRNRFAGLMPARISSITPQRWQASVNAEARVVSAKTLKNACGFISSVVSSVSGQHLEAQLPQVVPHEREFLDQEQIEAFLDALSGDKVEIAALLALSSLRRSEIMALTWDDVDLALGAIHVRGAVVQDEHNRLVRKAETKNASSTRSVPIIAPLRAALEKVEDKSGPVVTVSLTRMYYHINAVCKRCGLPEVGVHGLRHSFASLAYDLRMPEKVAMQIGGWSDEATMRKIYTHVSAKKAEAYRSDFTVFFENRNENRNKK